MISGLLKPSDSALLVIDIQERLMPVIQEPERVFSNCNKLISGFEKLGVQTIVTEQYPKGLGHTCDEMQIEGKEVVEKSCFSCLLKDDVMSKVKGRKSLVLCGVEAHICVLKTALDAVVQGFDVHVVADAVSSRSAYNHQYALERMRQSGIFICTTEMVLFQMMDFAGSEEFKFISKLIR